MYQYTQAYLIGILKTHQIGASNNVFPNDATENSYAIRLVRRLMKELGPPSELARRLLSEVRQRFASEAPALYVASFCESPDLLSMWRGYGSYERGRFAIGSWRLDRPDAISRV